MPSAVPINNSIAQNSVDFNNQQLNNSGNFFKYKEGVSLNNAAGHTASAGDINSIITCTSNNNKPNVATLNLTNLHPSNGVNINNGSSIIIQTHPGVLLNNVYVINNNGYLFTEIGNYVMTSGNGSNLPVAKLTLVDKSNNSWLLTGNLGTKIYYGFTNCCGDGETFYQITDDISGDITNPNIVYTYFFDSDDPTKPYNGIYTPDNGTSYYSVVNGVWVGGGDCSTFNFDFTSDYSFYTVRNDPGSGVTGYSVTGLSSDMPNTIVGNKFFNGTVEGQCPCYTTIPAFADGTYYSPNGNYSMQFYKGYLISYTSL